MNSISTSPVPRLSQARRRPNSALLAVIPIVVAILGAGAGLAYAHRQGTLYESQSDVVVSPEASFLDPANSGAFQPLTSTVQRLAVTQSVLEGAAAHLGGTPFKTVGNDLRLSIDSNTPLLRIDAVARTQSLASAIVAAETDSLTHAVGAIPRPGVSLKIFSQAEREGKIQPRPSRSALLGAGAGFIAACFGIALYLTPGRERPLE